MANLTEIKGSAAIDSTSIDSFLWRVDFESRGTFDRTLAQLHVVLTSWSPSFPFQQEEVDHLFGVVAASTKKVEL